MDISWEPQVCLYSGLKRATSTSLINNTIKETICHNSDIFLNRGHLLNLECGSFSYKQMNVTFKPLPKDFTQ